MCSIEVDRWPYTGFRLDHGLVSFKIVENEMGSSGAC